MDIPAPRERPPIARKHCRHYDYRHTGLEGMRTGDHGGPHCGVGIDLSGPGASKCCWPDPTAPCPKREEWTEQERAATQAWSDEMRLRLIVIVAEIPGSSDRKDKDNKWGHSGKFDCLGCGKGQVHWVRARSNGHIHAQCTTPWCFAIIQ
jgi:hypothetical protein